MFLFQYTVNSLRKIIFTYSLQFAYFVNLIRERDREGERETETERETERDTERETKRET